MIYYTYRIMHFDIKSPSTFITRVFTISTKDGKKKDIKLKVVYNEGKIYFTRRNKKSSWYKNLLNNDKAEFELGGKIFYGTAKEMNDKNLISHISQIKYTNEKKDEPRYGFEIKIEGEIT